MDIKVEGKLKFKNDGYSEFLKLIFYFKLPGQIFKKRITWILCRSSWKRYLAYTDFVEECKQYLFNEGILKEEVESIILDYLRKKKNKVKRNELEELFKDHKFSFNVTIKK